MSDRIRLVTEQLPNNGQRVLCFGHSTYCCVEDMEAAPDWHEVTFRFVVQSYRLKKEVPLDPEDSILEMVEVIEHWNIDEDELKEHVIGVTKWMPAPPKESV